MERVIIQFPDGERDTVTRKVHTKKDTNRQYVIYRGRAIPVSMKSINFNLHVSTYRVSVLVGNYEDEL